MTQVLASRGSQSARANKKAHKCWEFTAENNWHNTDLNGISVQRRNKLSCLENHKILKQGHLIWALKH